VTKNQLCNEQGGLKVESGISGGMKEKNSTLERGKTPLEERKTKIGMGKEIDTILKKKKQGNLELKGNPNPTKEKHQWLQAFMFCQCHTHFHTPLPMHIYIAFQPSWWECSCFSFHNLLSLYAHCYLSHKLLDLCHNVELSSYNVKV